MTEMNTATEEVAVEAVVETPTTEEVSQDAVQNTNEDMDAEVSAMLDSIFKTMEVEAEPKTFGPKITETIHESEAKFMLESIQKELDEKKASEQEVSQKNTELISELEALRIEQEEAKNTVQTQKSEIEVLEEFYKTLASVPVLGELVQMVANKGAESVNIPKYLNELIESRIMAQGVSPETTEVIAPVPVKQIESFENAIRRRNKR